MYKQLRDSEQKIVWLKIKKDFLMGKNTISQKIDNYVKQNLQTLKKEEAKELNYSHDTVGSM